MASITAIFSVLVMANTALAQMMPINPGCATPTHLSSSSVKVLTYTQWTPPQIAPTSTVYDMIVTHFDYVVWCSGGLATVTNVPASPTSSGPFTAQVHSSALTVQEVQCIQPDMVLTRREIRGNEYARRSVNERAIEVPATTSSKAPKATHHLDGNFPVPKSWKHDHAIHQPQAVGQANAKRQAMNTTVPTTLSPQAADLVSQLQTAQYALELCNDNFNLTEVCNTLKSLEAIAPLASVGVSAPQAANIVCWASVFGLDFNTTNAALLGDLAAAVYGLELGDNYTTTANTTNLCGNIDLAVAPYLGINSTAVDNFICGGPSAAVTVTAVSTQTVVVVPNTPTVTFSASAVGSVTGNPVTTFTPSGVAATATFSASAVGSVTSNPVTTFTPSGVAASGGLPFQSGLGTGAPYGWPNGTFPQPTGGSAVSGGAVPTGAGNPWGNSTGTDSMGIDFPPQSALSQGGGQNTPIAPDAMQYYPATTMETVTASYGGYL